MQVIRMVVENSVTFDKFEAVLVADACEVSAAETVRRLIEAECDVVGPVTTARMALALAAQTPVRHAVVAERLGGVRDGAQLAQALEATWGVKSVMLGASEDAPREPLGATAD